MPVDEPVTYWLRQLEAGDENAARSLWQRYYRELVKLARARFGTMPRRVADEEDVALSVLRCLYEGAARGQFAELDNRHDLWQLLATITGRKVIDQQRLLCKQKRGGGQVRGDSVLSGSNDEHLGVGFDQFRGDAPTPEVLAITAEEYRRLMHLLADDRLRQIAECKLEGYANEQIGERLSLACRSIERKLQRIRQIWRDELTACGEPPASVGRLPDGAPST
ncbi:MAG: ECF-type sigma factor [Pirellulales bacterium]